MSGHEVGSRRARAELARLEAEHAQPNDGFLLERTPKPEPDAPLSYRKDEYPDAA